MNKAKYEEARRERITKEVRAMCTDGETEAEILQMIEEEIEEERDEEEADRMECAGIYGTQDSPSLQPEQFMSFHG